MNRNLIWGIPLSLLVGWLLASLVHLLASAIGIQLSPMVQLILAIGIAIAWYIGGLHLIAVKHRGVVLLLGRRVRMGTRRGNELDDVPEPDTGTKKGLEEGWNFLPLPEPLMTVISVDVREKQLNFSPADVKTKDAFVQIDGNLQYWVEDPYDFQSVDQPVPSLEQITLRALRVMALKYKAIKLASTDRGQLAQETHDLVVADLQRPEVKWGLSVGLMTINNIQLPQVVRKALDQRIAEPIEGQAEQIQARRRVKQAKEIKELGVSPDTAYVGSLVDAGKAGAQATNISGLGDVGKAINTLTRRLTDRRGPTGGTP